MQDASYVRTTTVLENSNGHSTSKIMDLDNKHNGTHPLTKIRETIDPGLERSRRQVQGKDAGGPTALRRASPGLGSSVPTALRRASLGPP